MTFQLSFRGNGGGNGFIESAAKLGRRHAYSGFESTSENIATGVADRGRHTFDRRVAGAQSTARLINSGLLDKLSRSSSDLGFESSAELPRTEARPGREILHRKIMVEMADDPGGQIG